MRVPVAQVIARHAQRIQRLARFLAPLHAAAKILGIELERPAVFRNNVFTGNNILAYRPDLPGASDITGVEDFNGDLGGDDECPAAPQSQANQAGANCTLSASTDVLDPLYMTLQATSTACFGTGDGTFFDAAAGNTDNTGYPRPTPDAGALEAPQ